MTAAARLSVVANHPSRSKTDSLGRNPTPAEIRAARDRAGLSHSQAAAKVLGSKRAWEKWETEDPVENRRMHPGLFKLFLIVTNQPVPDWLK